MKLRVGVKFAGAGSWLMLGDGVVFRISGSTGDGQDRPIVRSRPHRRQFGQRDQVVAGDGHFRPQPVAGCSAVAQLPASGHRSHPAEDLLNSFPGPLAQSVPMVAAGAPVDGRPLLLGHMGRNQHVPASQDETPGVVTTIGPHGDPTRSRR